MANLSPDLLIVLYMISRDALTTVMDVNSGNLAEDALPKQLPLRSGKEEVGLYKPRCSCMIVCKDCTMTNLSHLQERETFQR
jgi:hypothetical protein